MTESNQTSSTISFGVPAVIAVLATGGLFPFVNKSMWIDEAASLYSSHLGWSALWQQSRVVDRVYLLYYAILHIWVELSGTIEWMRCLSLLAFALTVYLVGRLGVLLGGPWCGVLAAVLTATSPLMIEAALDARPYALATLSATASVVSLLKWIEGSGRKWIWLFSLMSILALLLQLFSALVPLAVLLVVFVIKNREFRRRSDEVVFPIGLMMIATVAFVVSVIGQRGQVAWIPPLAANTLGSDLVGPASGDPRYGAIHGYVLVVAFTIGLSLICFFVERARSSEHANKIDIDPLGISLVWAVSSTLGLLVISLVTPVFFDRYLTASVPGLALFLSLLLGQIVGTTQSARARALQTGGLGALFAIAFVVLAVNTDAVAANVFENLKGVSHFLESHVGARGEAALPNHAMTAGIIYYVQSDHQSLRTWPDVANQRYLTGPDLRETTSNEPKNVWLVIDASVNGTKEFVAMLGRDGYKQVGTTQFDAVVNVTIEHFRMDPRN